MTCFRPIYFYWTIVLFFVEVLIALFVHDGIIRPFLGDVLVVILIYCLKIKCVREERKLRNHNLFVHCLLFGSKQIQHFYLVQI